MGYFFQNSVQVFPRTNLFWIYGTNSIFSLLQKITYGILQSQHKKAECMHHWHHIYKNRHGQVDLQILSLLENTVQEGGVLEDPYVFSIAEFKELSQKLRQTCVASVSINEHDHTIKFCCKVEKI